MRKSVIAWGMLVAICFTLPTGLKAQDRPLQFRLAYAIKLGGEELLTGVAICHAGIACELTSSQLAEWGVKLTYTARSPRSPKADSLAIVCADRDCAFSNYRRAIDIDQQRRIDILEGSGVGLRVEMRRQLGEIYLMRTKFPGEDSANEQEPTSL